MNKELWITCWN